MLKESRAKGIITDIQDNTYITFGFRDIRYFIFIEDEKHVEVGIAELVNRDKLSQETLDEFTERVEFNDIEGFIRDVKLKRFDDISKFCDKFDDIIGNADMSEDFIRKMISDKLGLIPL